MWKISNINTGLEFYFLDDKEKYSIGRHGVDVVLTSDATISRTHALIYPNDDSIELVDCGSKYGTYCNENIESSLKVTPLAKIELKSGDKVRFGCLKSVFQLSKIQISTVISSLDEKQKKALQQNLNPLNGKILASWEKGCTHLTMDELKITVKVLFALIDHIPIVTCKYWEVYLKNIKSMSPLPKTEDFKPKPLEMFLNKSEDYLQLNENRKNLFAGKTFIFMNKRQMETFADVVVKAGGQARDLKKQVQKQLLLKKNVIVVQYTPSSQSQSSQVLGGICEFIEEHNRRSIPDYEIGLAIVNCSIDRYCNPDYKVLSEILPSTLTLETESDVILAEDTPILKTEKMSKLAMESRQIIVPETQTGQRPFPTIDLDSEDDISARSSNVACRPKSCEPSEIFESNCGKSTEPFIPKSGHPDKYIAPFMPKIHTKKFTDSLNLKKRKVAETETNLESAFKDKDLNDGIEDNEEFNLPKRSKSCMSSQGFISKRISIISEKSNLPSTSKEETKPKRKLALVTDFNEANDGDEDLFNFGNSKKKSKLNISVDNDDEEDDLFNFKKSKIKEDVIREDVEKVNNIPIKDIIKVQRPIVTKYPIVPIKITSDGWLSTSLNKMKIKCEEINIKEEVRNPAIEQWINSIKNGFKVESLDITLPLKQSSSKTPSSYISKSSLNSTGKNFKTFVKKYNYKPQKHVITTVPVSISLC